MVRNVEKLIKIDCPNKIPEIKIESMKSFPKTLRLDLIDIEPYTEPGIKCNVDLGLDQLEECEE